MIIGEVTRFVIDKGCSFLMDRGLGNLVDKFAPNPVDKAYDQALKKWCRNSEIREKYAIFKYSHFEAFREYLQKGPEMCNNEILSLCKLFEEELNKDPKAYQFIQDLYNKSVLQGQKNIQYTLEEFRTEVLICAKENTSQHIEIISRLIDIEKSLSNQRKLETTSAEAYDYDKNSYIIRSKLS